MRTLLYSLGLIALQACTATDQQEDNQVEEVSVDQQSIDRAKFEPEDGKCILFVGQELAAIGGLEEFNDGYLGRPQKVGADFRLLSYQSGDVRRLSKQQSLPLLSL